ncbi:hypothetical protein [Massilia endophytica]|uniref:hypothetical protein n=1 Tax=Massilia endophytica TaxID=2899220 RepID=UPI001E39640B|nr:hypothetical protein [Massilia endophytica]UGQ44935.1 hypothetical protein LSQ66_14125 [Massilia endophytica]
MMNAKDLKDLKELEALATEGPWHSPGMGEIHMESHDSVAEICFPHEHAEPGERFGKQEDADFIAAIRNAAPELIALAEKAVNENMQKVHISDAENAMQPTPTTAEKGAVDLSGLPEYTGDSISKTYWQKHEEFYLVSDVRALLAAQPVDNTDEEYPVDTDEQHAARMAFLYGERERLAAQPGAHPDDNCEGWEVLAMALAEEEGADPHQLIWEGNPPEPWGEVWQRYAGEAKRMIEMVRKHAVAPVASKEAVSDEAEEDAYVIDRMGKLLAGVAVALKGPEAARHRHGYQDLPELAEKLVLELELHRLKDAQAAALSASAEKGENA